MNKIKEILNRKSLIYAFVARDLKTRYRGSALGFLWSFIDPLINALVLWFVFSYIFARGIPNLPLYLVSGIVMWNLFSLCLAQGSNSIIINGPIIKKIRLPRQAFPLSVILANLIHFILAFLVLIIFIIASHVPFNPVAWLLIPIVLLLFSFCIFGISLFLASLSVYFRDVPPLTESLLKVWYFATPIFYEVTMVPDKIRKFYLLNPAASAITAFRRIIMEGKIPEFYLFRDLILVTIIVFIIGWFTFSRLDKGFADEV